MSSAVAFLVAMILPLAARSGKEARWRGTGAFQHPALMVLPQPAAP